MFETTYKVGEIYGILEKIYNDPISRRTTVPLFMSDSGLGKTYIIEKFMKDKGVYKPPFVLSQRMPFEVSGMANIDKIAEKMKYYDFDFLLELKDGDILFIDETFAANPLTLSAFLTFLESRIMISGKELPDIMIVAAANPQGMPVLTSQIRRRFLQYDIVFDKESWGSHMLDKYSLPPSIVNKLTTLIKKEDFKGCNYATPADFDKAIGMIIRGNITPYEKVLTPILETFVTNTSKKPLVLSKERTLEVGEKMSWLEMIRIDNDIVVEVEDTADVTHNSSNAIKISDNAGNILGEIKSLEILKSMYVITPEHEHTLSTGGMIFPPRHWSSLSFSASFSN